MTTTTKENVHKQIAALDRMTVGQLQKRYAEAFAEPARSGNRQWLIRRIAWRLQMLAEGDLARRAMDRARERAHELARGGSREAIPLLRLRSCPEARLARLPGAFTTSAGT